MKENHHKKPRSCWSGGNLNWLAAKSLKAAASFFQNGVVMVLTVTGQLFQTAGGDYCFTVAGHETPNLLKCINAQQEKNLGNDLQLQSNITTTAPTTVCDQTYYQDSHIAYYGETALSHQYACSLRYGDTLDPTVNTIIRRNVQNGILGGSGDIAIMVLIVGGAITVLFGSAMITCCLVRKWSKDKQRVEKDPFDEHVAALLDDSTSKDSENSGETEPLVKKSGLVVEH